MDLQIEIKEEYLLARLSGKFNLDDVEGLIIQAVEACKEHHCSCLLVDSREMTGKLSIMDRHQAGLLIVEYNKSLVKIAIVSTNRHILPTRYLETVISNRWVPIRVTPDFEEAEEWLLTEG